MPDQNKVADNTLGDHANQSTEPKENEIEAYNRYIRWWPCPDGATGPEADEARKKRIANANQLAIDFYDLVSFAYERGWGRLFHYGPLLPGLSIKDSLQVHEELVGSLIGLKEGMKVLDVGCGIAGPARHIAKTFNVKVVGITNSALHVERGRDFNREAGLEDQVVMVLGDYNHMPFEDNTFDAAYAFDPICYAPDLTVIYKELHRVLKPNAPLGFQEWVMTDTYDPTNPKHRKLLDQIERGNGLSKTPLISLVRSGLRDSGFFIIHEERMEARSKPGPWYFPLLGMVRYATNVGDFVKTLKMERKVVVPLTDLLYWVLVKLKMAPRALPGALEILKIGTKSVAVGAKEDIFSPVAVFVARNVK